MSRRIRKARGDVQAVSIPSNERRRVGAGNRMRFIVRATAGLPLSEPRVYHVPMGVPVPPLNEM